MPIEARMSEPCFIPARPLRSHGLQTANQARGFESCLAILPLFSEAPLYRTLDKTPSGRQGQVVQGYDGIEFEYAECCRGDHLGRHQELGDADDAHKRRVLQHGVELVAE